MSALRGGGSCGPGSGSRLPKQPEYAIGKTAGATDVVPWTSAGTAAGVTRTGLTLTMGQKYHFCVKAKNGFGFWSAIAQSNGVMIAQESTVMGIKGIDGSPRVGFRGAVVTSATGDMSLKIFVQDPSRRGGGVSVITIASPEINVHRGDIVDVCGTLSGTTGTRYLTAPSVGVLTTGNDEPNPLSMTNTSVTGANLNTVELGAGSSPGPYNVGLLVRTWGKVTSGGTSPFYIDDGSGYVDPVSGKTGLRVVCTGTVATLTPPAKDQYVLVTGISQVTVSGSHRIRTIQVRDQNDIRVLR